MSKINCIEFDNELVFTEGLKLIKKQDDFKTDRPYGIGFYYRGDNGCSLLTYKTALDRDKCYEMIKKIFMDK